MKNNKRKRSTFGTITDSVLKNDKSHLEDKRDFSFENKVSNRKQMRKEKRLMKKKRRDGFAKHVLFSDHVEQPPVQNAVVKTPENSEPLKKKEIQRVEQEPEKPQDDSATIEAEMEKYKKSAEKRHKKQLVQANSLEDKTIHTLEKKLHINSKKKKGLPSSFKADGFDYILNLFEDDCKFNEDDDNESDDEFLKNKRLKRQQNDDQESDHSNNEDDFFQDTNLLDEEQNALGEDEEEVDNDKESINEDDLRENSRSEDDSSGEDADKKNIQKSTTEVDLATKYVPPALRRNSDGKNFIQLQRQMKGLLNRVSDSNLNKVANDIENMYRENSRAIINKVFSGLIQTMVFQGDPVPDKLNMETAMLICVVSRRIAIEVLSYVLEDLVCKLKEVLDEDYSVGKSVNNTVVLIANLYRLKITHGNLPIDLLTLFAELFTEKNVELILLLLQFVGFQLRQDDPSAFKNIVQKIVSKAGDTEYSEGSRMAFMLDTLTAIKNNNARKLTQYYDPEMVKQCRKKVSVAVGNSSSATDKLPAVTMENFLNGDKNGRWWVVGSAWAGVPMLDKNNDGAKASSNTGNVSSKLVEAARKQRMNTDLRRSIFYAIMTADDYVNAFEKILTLGLKDKQVQEVPHVIVECCQQGKSYNAFYCHLLTKFCLYDRQYVLGIQCTFWDRFKLLSEFKLRQNLNLSKLLAQLVLNNSLPLSVLKNLDFTQLNKSTVKFLRNFFSELTEKSAEEFLPPAKKLSTNKKFRSVSQGLLLFLYHFVLEENIAKDLPQDFMQKINLLADALKSSNKVTAFSL